MPLNKNNAKMDSVVKLLESRPTDAESIIRFCDGKPNFCRYSDLKNANSLDEVLKNGMLLLLYDQKGRNAVGHFCTVIKDERAKVVEFFDPYADYTDDFIKDRNTRYLTRLMLEYVDANPEYEVVMNDHPLQKLRVGRSATGTAMSTCGRHAACRLRTFAEMGLSLDDYCKLIQGSKKEDPDRLVTLLTFFLS